MNCPLNATVSRSDVEQFVRITQPWGKYRNLDFDSIVDEVISRWSLVGITFPIPDFHRCRYGDTPDVSVSQFIDKTINTDEYWRIVAAHDRKGHK